MFVYLLPPLLQYGLRGDDEGGPGCEWLHVREEGEGGVEGRGGCEKGMIRFEEVKVWVGVCGESVRCAVSVRGV